MKDFDLYLQGRRAQVDAELERQMPPLTARPRRLHEAMRYAVFSGGKRLRPLLCLAAAEACGAPAAPALPSAASIELLHTYTLVHDDLPCMDDDDLRRGRPTVHRAFDEATALLAGDALLTLAFEALTRPPAPAGPAARLVFELASAAGSLGVIGGQVEDMEAEGRPPAAEQVDYIHTHKTAALIRASVRMGAIAGGAGEDSIAAVTRYGDCAGLAFQIVDDILNATSTPEELGKPAGTDAARQKATYVAVHGLDHARRRAAALVEEAVASVAGLGSPADALIALARFVASRTK